MKRNSEILHRDAGTAGKRLGQADGTWRRHDSSKNWGKLGYECSASFCRGTGPIICHGETGGALGRLSGAIS